ncbi:MAG: hypothetical protein AABZ57_04665, partial [Candidatus Margulisiibacteriota bacterium]
CIKNIMKKTLSIKKALNQVHVVVAVADSPRIINSNHIKASAAGVVLIDCGKGCFSDEVCSSNMVYRTDVGMSLIYQLKKVIESQNTLHPKFGKKKIDGRKYVCGISGIRGDVVVMDINDIDSVVGVCDGEGGIVKSNAGRHGKYT